MNPHFMAAAGVRAQFEAMLLQPVFAGVERAFGEYGAIATQSFEALIARMLERER